MSPIRSRWILGASAALALSASAQTPRAQAPGAVWVRIVDADQEPMPGAEVVLPLLGVSLKVPSGGALLITGVPEGTYLVQARQVGYAPAWRTLRVGRDTIATQLALGPLGQPLDPVDVTAKLTPVESRLIDFERRRNAKSFGHFITREEIDERKPHDVATILRWVPGVQVVTSQSVTSVYSRRATSKRCVGMLTFLDGVLVSGRPDMMSDAVLGGATAGPVRVGTGGSGGGYRPSSVGSSSGSSDATRGSTSSGSGSSSSGSGSTSTGNTGSTTTGSSGSSTSGRNIGATGRLAVGGEPNWGSMAGSSGVGSRPTFEINTIPTSLIAGMEVYTTVAGVPAEYAGFIGSECGVILMWTAAR